MSLCLLLGACGGGNGVETPADDAAAAPGSEGSPFRVILVPADGGTEQGTLADFEPVFSAITQSHGMHFDIRVGQSYNAVIEAMALNKVDIAFFGPVSYTAAKERDAAELLAVSVTGGESVYYSGLFARRDSGITSIKETKGRSLALGDVNSTSSFNFPVAMLLAAEIDPARDMGALLLAGSHASSLEAMASGKVDIAAASYTSYEKAVENGMLDPTQIVAIAKSEPIPNPPLAMHPSLDESAKAALREAFHTVHESPGVTPDMLRGYGGKRVDRYDAEYDEAEFEKAMAKLALVTDEVKTAILRKASDG